MRKTTAESVQLVHFLGVVDVAADTRLEEARRKFEKMERCGSIGVAFTFVAPTLIVDQ